MFRKRLYEIADAVNEGYRPTYWSQKGKYQKEYDELWDKLVPGMGEADTEAGELIRSVTKIYYDLYNNGFGNGPFKDEWRKVKENDAFRKHVDREALELFDEWFTDWMEYGRKIVDNVSTGFFSNDSDTGDEVQRALDKIVDAVVQAAMDLHQQNEENLSEGFLDDPNPYSLKSIMKDVIDVFGYPADIKYPTPYYNIAKSAARQPNKRKAVDDFMIRLSDFLVEKGLDRNRKKMKEFAVEIFSRYYN